MLKATNTQVHNTVKSISLTSVNLPK